MCPSGTAGLASWYEPLVRVPAQSFYSNSLGVCCALIHMWTYYTCGTNFNTYYVYDNDNITFSKFKEPDHIS